MNLAEFRTCLAQDSAPTGLGAGLRALWHLGRKEWDTAHALVQDENDPASAWVHAHVHRIEGDLSNAAYWYRRAGRPRSEKGLEEEWEEMVSTLLASQAGDQQSVEE